MTRISAKEAYSNRDLIAQIARLKTYVEQGTFKEVSTSYSGGVLTLTFTAFDDSTQSFNIPMDSIVGVTGDQVGNTVTIHVEFASGTVVDIPYTIPGDTSPTPDTFALRDANGKLFAADPANGATDGTLVTANWISQTGDSSPNNVIHRSGLETYSGPKIFEHSQNSLLPTMKVDDYANGDNGTCYLEGVYDNNDNWMITELIGTDVGDTRGYYQKSIALPLNNTSHQVDIRINITTSGLTIEILDPILNTWKTVKLE